MVWSICYGRKHKNVMKSVPSPLVISLLKSIDLMISFKVMATMNYKLDNIWPKKSKRPSLRALWHTHTRILVTHSSPETNAIKGEKSALQYWHINANSKRSGEQSQTRGVRTFTKFYEKMPVCVCVSLSLSHFMCLCDGYRIKDLSVRSFALKNLVLFVLWLFCSVLPLFS